MSATIITIAQQKGGAGKTTLAAQLAVAWAQGRRKVAVVDIDPQGSLTAWHMARRRTLADQDAGGIHLSTVAGWRLGTELDRLRKEFDLVVVDSPPHAETEAKAAIRAASLVLVPVQPSPMDLWAIGPTIDIARKEKRPYLVVLNRMPPRGRLAEQVKEKLAEDAMPVARAALGNRTPFAASMMEGRGVVETAARSPAAKEVEALAAEVRKTAAP
jgi:chromosome partitioning protein